VTGLGVATGTVRTSPVAAVRPDIQGLRALAVLAVLADHLFGWPTGGYVGVDVFFVISGFLITALLLREYESSGRISLVSFYRRRARRILPAATVCLAVTVAAAWLVYRSARFASIADDALWSLLFVSNWHFAAAGTDYLGAIGPVSPLQHYWSLAVEEQFYLCWPLIAVAILGLTRRRGSRRSSVVAIVAGVLVISVIGTFLLAVFETASEPAWAYFSTLSRVWELAAGALLAVAAGRCARIPSRWRYPLAVSGLVMIGSGMLLFGATTAIPGPWSAVPVVGALLVLAAGIGVRAQHPWLLCAAPAGYIGRISYSLYLWHFPVIVLSAALLPAGPASTLSIIVVISALSAASFHLVEEPLRRGHGVVGRAKASSWWRFRGAGGLVGLRTAVIAAVAGIPAILLATILGPSQSQLAATAAPGLRGGSAQAVLSADLDSALRADQWPELSPAIDGISDSGRPPRDRECAAGLTHVDRSRRATGAVGGGDELGSVIEGRLADCVFGDLTSGRLAVVAGDSIAITWIPMVRELLEPFGYRVQGLTMSGCPFVATDMRNAASDIAAFCPDHKAATVAAINALQPDLLFVSNTFEPWLAGDVGSDGGAARYAAGQRSIVEELAGSTNAVYLLAPPPPGKALEDCATLVSTPANCVSGVPDQWRRFNDAMTESLASTTRTTYIDTSGWFCSAAGQCPSFVGQTPTRRDAVGHVVPAFAERLAPVLSEIVGDRSG